MAYIGLQPQQKTVATSTQQLSGNGVDLEFSLNRAVSKAADILVFVGSSIKVPETDYTAYDNTLLFTNAPAGGTNNISVSYKAGALSTVYIEANSYPIGSTTTPSIRSVDAAATGIYWPSTTSVGITVSGNTRVLVSDSVAGHDAPSTGALRVVGGAGITGALFTSGIIKTNDTSQATNSTSGALVVSGGVGIAKDTYIAGALSVAGDFTVAGQFTTTGSDSLILNDPFVFLANANPGDNLDSGFVSSYYDGSNQRYTGLFRDITDGQYKLFKNLLVSPTTTVDTGNVSFQYANLIVGNITATNIFGTVAGSADITTVGNLANLRVQTTITSWGINYLYSTQAASSTSSGALQVSGGAGIAGNLYAANVNATTNVTATNLSGTLVTAAQTNITSVGTLTGLTVAGTTTARAIAAAGHNLYDIGASGTTFATIYGQTFSGVSTTAKYADLAENYLADAEYAPGTVLMFGGDNEVTECKMDMCPRVAGVVSTAPAHLMNTGLEGDYIVALALSGRVPCKVTGAVTKGDMMVSAGNGHARAEANPKVGAVIGKALENFDGLEGVIEVVVGRI